MDDIDKLNLIFKADNIELGLQLVKSLGLNLKDVLVELYDRYKYDLNNEYRRNIIWWVLNNTTFKGVDIICIKYDNVDGEYKVWIRDFSTKIYQGKSYKTLDECFNLLVDNLKESDGILR